ncbi:unnamed protein product [Diatraea saccharalis]|uniref:Uncharacterized protein n=1 Tax=Diatraea saccharalis TaxID=40085 RepID=A0A9N9WG94_9NEOP|nr:unnamed protein product [Diatraea saccharalis]
MYIMHVTEFQKRGQTYAHNCFREEGGDPVQNVDIDQFVRADLPASIEAEGRLRKAVLDHIIHGSCGPPFRTDLPYWDPEKKGVLSFSITYCDDRGFVHLKRSSKNEATIKYQGKDVPINDLWVVSYNTALLLKYDNHIYLCAY